MAKRKAAVKYDPAPGYCLTVGGQNGYVGMFVPSSNPNAKAEVEAEVTEPYHDVRPAVVLTLADYRRLVKQSKPRPTRSK